MVFWIRYYCNYSTKSELVWILSEMMELLEDIERMFEGGMMKFIVMDYTIILRLSVSRYETSFPILTLKYPWARIDSLPLGLRWTHLKYFLTFQSLLSWSFIPLLSHFSPKLFYLALLLLSLLPKLTEAEKHRGLSCSTRQRESRSSQEEGEGTLCWLVSDRWPTLSSKSSLDLMLPAELPSWVLSRPHCAPSPSPKDISRLCNHFNLRRTSVSPEPTIPSAASTYQDHSTWRAQTLDTSVHPRVAKIVVFFPPWNSNEPRLDLTLSLAASLWCLPCVSVAIG